MAQVQFNDRGEEIPDPTPVEVPLKFRNSVSEHERIMSIVRNELSKAVAERGAETFEEADDFDCEEDDADLPYSPHELTPMHEDAKFMRKVNQKEKEDGEREAGPDTRESREDGSTTSRSSERGRHKRKESKPGDEPRDSEDSPGDSD